MRTDYISRQALLTAIQKAYVDTNGGEDRQKVRINVGLTMALNLVQDAPSVQPKAEQELKTGHWIGSRRVGCGFGEYKEYIVPIKDGIVTDSCHCSECGEWLTGSDEYECYGNYCPNCGARMESEVEQ